ncbi:hypothetical protein A2U01_0047577, partial [Trifolium medium]|nr:hypothetical protein [Trifolium medium]
MKLQEDGLLADGCARPGLRGAQ